VADAILIMDPVTPGALHWLAVNGWNDDGGIRM